MNVWWNKKGGLEKQGWREGETETDEAEDDCYDCCGGGVAAGFGHDGWVSFSFVFFFSDWIGLRLRLDWSGPSAVGGVAVTGVSLQLYVAQVARYLMVAEREKNPMIMIAVVVKMMK